MIIPNLPAGIILLSDGDLFSQLTLADLALYDVMQYPLDLFGVTLEKYPKVAAHRQKVEGVPKVNEYLKKRPSEDKFVTRRLGPDVKKWYVDVINRSLLP